MTDLLLGFYGDDFTGSTDAMDALSRAGIDTVLFLEPPSQADLDDVADAQAIGVAGTSRSLSPAAMERELEPAFAALAETTAPIVHYKICSTFDSSPEVGNIGTAIDAGVAAFDGSTVPLLPGAPPLGRYVVFGNMFAEADGDEVYRLDRHPTMRDHPITPMSESDLLRHLSGQTDREMDLVDIHQLRERPDEAHDEAASETDILFFDTLDDADLTTVGRLLWERYAADGSREPGFVIGSSGVEYALADHWTNAGLVEGDPEFDPLEPAEPTLVMSGSASPVTKRQIEIALDEGFEGIRIDTERLIRPDTAADERDRVIAAASEALEHGNSAIIYTALGPDDPAIQRTRDAVDQADDPPENLTEHIGDAQGEILRAVAADYDPDRVCIAGGDTCGQVAPRLGIDALTVRYPLAAGSPVCEVIEGETGVRGLQVALKGGQLGGPEYFVKLREGDRSMCTDSDGPAVSQ